MPVLSGKAKTSIVTQLSLLFLTLAVINLIVTWIFSGANQMRLISEKANLSGSSVAFEVLRRIGSPLTEPGRGPKAAVVDIGGVAEKLRAGPQQEKTIVPEFMIVTGEFEFMGAYPPGSARRVTADVSQNILKALQLRDLSGQAYFARPNISGFTIDLYIPLPSVGSRDLVFITQISVDSIREDLKSLIRLIFATIGIMLAIQVAIGFLIYRILIKPIRDVSSAAVAIGGGNFSKVDVPRRQRDEILLLIESFNQMSSELKQKDETIRNQVEELQEKNDTMDFELEIAERIQQSIMPDAEKLDSFRAALEYVPLYRVSGDYYDIAHLEDGSVAIIIADASGHGVPAAFLTILMKVFFTDLVHKYSDVAQLMHEVNRSISRYLESTGFYLTAFLIRVWPSGEAQYCNCGHPAQVHLTTNGDLAELSGDCDVIGLTVDNDRYTAAKIHLAETDKLVLFTDGLTELRNAEGEFMPEDKFLELLRTHGASTAAQLRQEVLAFARGFQGAGKASDDMTLVVLTVADLFSTGANAGVHATQPAETAGEPRDMAVARLLQQIIEIYDAPSYHALLANAYLRLGKTELARETVVNAMGKFSGSETLGRLSRKLHIGK